MSAFGTGLPAAQKTPLTMIRIDCGTAKSPAWPREVPNTRPPQRFFHVHATKFCQCGLGEAFGHPDAQAPCQQFKQGKATGCVESVKPICNNREGIGFAGLLQ